LTVTNPSVQSTPNPTHHHLTHSFSHPPVTQSLPSPVNPSPLKKERLTFLLPFLELQLCYFSVFTMNLSSLRLESNPRWSYHAAHFPAHHGLNPSFRRNFVSCSSIKPSASSSLSVAESFTRDSASRIESLSQVSGVLGSQWGDEGKGKLVDILAEHFDIVARCQVLLHTHLTYRTELFLLQISTGISVFSVFFLIY